MTHRKRVVYVVSRLIILLASLFVLTVILLAACGAGASVPTSATSITASLTPIVPLAAPSLTSTTIPSPAIVQDLSTSIYTPTSQYLDTPTLIDQALARGEITHEERLLYLAYALYEYESLPTQFRSNYGWFGEVAANELREVVNSPARLCSMSPHVQNELRRLVGGGTCNQN